MNTARTSPTEPRGSQCSTKARAASSNNPPRAATDQQQRAIEARGVSVSLSAGAGCGKTFVLTERFLSHLQGDAHANDPDDLLHQLIAITFTERAAREMRDRIREKCYERLNTSAAEAAHWLQLLRSLDGARVSTIHAFCAGLLRSNAVEAQLDPHFSVLDAAQSGTLLAEICEDVLREALADAQHPLHEPAIELAAQFDLAPLLNMVFELAPQASRIDFDAWLARTPREIVDNWRDFHTQQVIPLVLRQISQSAATCGLLAVLGELNPVPPPLVDARNTLLDELPRLLTAADPADQLARLREAAKMPRQRKNVWADDDQRDRFRVAADAFRKEVDKYLKNSSTLTFDPEAALSDAAAGLQLLAFVREVHAQYEWRKREQALLDFDDLLIRAHRLLTNPAHAELQERLSAQVQLLLVDECQDTDPVQVELIKALCGPQCYEGKLFFVGDHKQSIYRFRGADPQVFRRLQAETPPQGRLPLSENFRSQAAILDFVNALFCDALSGDDPQLRYEPLVARREQVTPLPAVEFLWTPAENDENETAASEDGHEDDEIADRDAPAVRARKREADLIARRIRLMLDRAEALAGERQPDGAEKPRPVRNRDIAILFRALSDVQHYEEALRNYGIDYYLVGGHAFYAQQEIFDIVNLLRALASPADEVSLAGVLRSPMFAIRDEALFWLARHPQGLGGGLFAAVLPGELADDDRRRVEFAASALRHLRRMKDRVPIAALLNEALLLTGYDAALMSEFMGERKLANLRKLIDQARAIDQAGVLGLADFIVQLSQFIANEPREPLAATQGEETNVVRLMTIHQAKGLEFPVVFVADIGRRQRVESATAAWRQELGPLVKLPQRGDVPKHTTGLDLFRLTEQAEDAAERLRLFYVAATRAADYLVLSGGRSKSELASPWMKLLAERFDLDAGQCKAVLPAVKQSAVPRAKVVTQLPVLPSRGDQRGFASQLQTTLDKARRLAGDTTVGELAGECGNLASSNGDDIHENNLCRPVLPDRAARRRFSVSRLKGELEIAAEGAWDTNSMQGDQAATVAPLDLGTLAHAVLERIDFSAPQSLDNVIVQVFAARPGDDEDHAQAIRQMVSQFLASDRAREIAAATVVHRELEFLLSWPPEPPDRSAPSAAGRYLQGVIDCLYQDHAGHWCVIDYKTNRVSADSLAAAAAEYEMQMGVYALAVQEILRDPPVELTLHFLRTGDEYRFQWNESKRKKIVDRVNQAIERVLMPVRASPGDEHRRL